MKKTTAIYLLMPMLLLSSCKQHYEVTGMQRSRILVDARYDVQPDQKVADFLKPYKHQVDSVMGPVVGRSARYMTAQRPEGTLSNLLADILVWAGKDYGESPTLVFIIWVVFVPTCQRGCDVWRCAGCGSF